MATWLSRPIFPSSINWAETPSERFTYALSDLVLAHAAPRYAPTADHVTRGVKFQIACEEPASIDVYDAFLDGLQGRSNGFWLVTAESAFEIVAGVSATQCVIRDQRLREELANRPIYVALLKPGSTTQYAKVTAAVVSANHRELVTLDSSPPGGVGLSTAVDATWEARVLWYARMGEDTEELEYLADGVQMRSVVAVELPHEYAQLELGIRPVYLYDFYVEAPGGDVHWRFTGLNVAFTSLGDTFASFPITHQGHRRSITGSQNQLTLLAAYDADCPLSQFFPFKLPRSLWVSVYRVEYATPDTRVVVFNGVVEDIELSGIEMRAKCLSAYDALGRRVPRFLIQNQCNYVVYSGPCGVDRTQHDAHAKIKSITGRYVVLYDPTTESPDRYRSAKTDGFAGGWLETGSGASFEVHDILRNSTAFGDDELWLYLATPLAWAVVDQTVTLYLGCDGRHSTCRATFNNFTRWGGHAMALDNLSVQAMRAETVSAGKK